MNLSEAELETTVKVVKIRAQGELRRRFFDLGIVEGTNIKVLYELPDLYIVGSGISAGDKILLEGVQKVKDDQKLKVKFQDPLKVIKSLKLKAE